MEFILSVKEGKNAADCLCQDSWPNRKTWGMCTESQQHSPALCHRIQQHRRHCSYIHVPVPVCVLSSRFFLWLLLLPYVACSMYPQIWGRRGKVFVLLYGWSLLQYCTVFSLPLLDCLLSIWEPFWTPKAEELQETSYL